MEISWLSGDVVHVRMGRSGRGLGTERTRIPQRRRGRHIISDTRRVVDFSAAARVADLRAMGRLVVASHRSMQHDYEISCEEIDFLVDTAIGIPGVYGARMTGGGFGGCTVNLVAPEAVDAFKKHLTETYGERYGKTPVFYECKPAGGAGLA